MFKVFKSRMDSDWLSLFIIHLLEKKCDCNNVFPLCYYHNSCVVDFSILLTLCFFGMSSHNFHFEASYVFGVSNIV